MVSKSLSLDLKNDHILVANLHPGWVQTDMGGKSAPVTQTESAVGVLRVLAAMGESHSGNFYDFQGLTVPW